MEEDKKIADILQKLLLNYGFSECAIEEISSPPSKNGISSKVFMLRVPEEDSRFLIGQFGNNLQALQYIARTVVSKQLPNLSNSTFFVDVNEYRKKRDQSVIELARVAARDALRSGKEVVLRPMSAYDRRLVHLELLKERSVTTESLGEKEARRIVIKPLNLEENLSEEK